jgi:two-component system, cell cycle sensor histidine kinase and response regulator CckA
MEEMLVLVAEESSGSPFGERPSILVVDEDPANISAVARALAGIDVRIVNATSGESALIACLSETFRMAIVAVQMLDMGGCEFARILQSNSSTARMPIVLVTASKVEVDALACQAGGCHLLDSYEASALRLEVQAILSRARNDRSLTNVVGDERDERVPSTSRYRDLFDTMPVGVVCFDARGVPIDANVAAVELLGIPSPKQLDGFWELNVFSESGAPLSRSNHPAHLAVQTRQVERAIVGYGIGAERVWLDVSATPRFRRGNAAPFEVFTTFTDITRRFAAERCADSFACVLQSVFDASLDGMLVVDMDTLKVLQFNDAMGSLFGVSARALEADGRPYGSLELYLSNDQISVLREAYESLQGHPDSFQRVELVIDQPGGTTKLVEVVVKFIVFDIAKCLLAIVRDVTDNLRSERDRRNFEQQVFQAQKMDSLGMLAAGIAHDFNNHLSVMMGYIGIALDQEIDESLREDLVEMEKAAKSSAELTRKLLAFSRRQPMRMLPVDLNELLRSVSGLLERTMGEDVELHLALDPCTAEVLADRSQLEQVVMNLAVNARDALPNGGRITFETTTVEGAVEGQNGLPAGAFVRLRVVDNGLGMDRATLHHIFEPFFTTKAVGKGTGLGLSTVHGIVRQSNGHVFVTSEVGVGTTFEVYLPKMPKQLASGEYRISEYEQLAHTMMGGGETILVVEDSHSVRNVLVRMLRTNGYEVLVAVDGVDAKHVLEVHKGHIDLVLIDLVMPRMGAQELAPLIRSLRPNAKVLFMSGYSGATVWKEGFDSPRSDFISKPVSRGLLLKMVRGVLRASSRAS